jgi:hypothetical protein
MGEWLLSQRDGAIVAWHEVPGRRSLTLSAPWLPGVLFEVTIFTEARLGLIVVISLRSGRAFSEPRLF